jgi:sigma-B regulation protein RsbU (phosphoserine phosphatase)
MIYARVDLRRQRLTYVDCGHTPVLHYRAFERDVVELPKAGGDLSNMPLGMSPEGRFRDMTVSFSAGDALLFYTDGLTERLGDRSERAGRERLRALLHQFRGCSAEEVVAGIRAAADEAGGDGMDEDDRSVVVVKPGSVEIPGEFAL